MKGLVPYMLGICLLIAAATYLGNSDPITPAIVEARAETSTGPVLMSVVNQGLAFSMKLLMGATVAGLASAAYVEGRKLYRKWWSEKLTGRGPWKSGPNANYQQAQKMPKLTREDILLMALANQNGRPQRVGSMRVPRSSDQEANDEINIDL